jgi:hypothetical protein
MQLIREIRLLPNHSYRLGSKEEEEEEEEELRD